MKIKILLPVLILWLGIGLNTVCAQTITDTIFDRSAHEDFAFGADISWGGSNLKDKNGVSKDLLTILKEQGLNSIRLRVWYPENGASGKKQVVRQAKEAHDKGFKVMIDFHYSDSWADPGKQYIPSAWAGHSTEELIQDVYDHTYDVLKALKDVGVTPAWVQIGNETKRGMLWPNGNTNDTPGGMDNFAKMINSGYDAIKAIDSTIQAIVHLPDADENSLYRWMFDALKARGAKWDIIGMSAYPRWAHLDWETEIELSVANMKDMIERYDTKVMVVETGHYWYEPYISNNFMVELMDTMMTYGALGCFWWEPQAMGFYTLTAWDPDTRQPTIAMDAYLGIKHINPNELIKVALNEPKGNDVFEIGQSIELDATANHVNGEIEKVGFYVDEKLVAEVSTKPFSYQISNLKAGIHSIYVTATDKKNLTISSEPTTIFVGAVTAFQENEDGFCGIKDDKGSIDTDHDNYTGDGFINTDNEIGSTVKWAVDFKEPGKYNIQFRYAATSDRPGRVVIDNKSMGGAKFPSTGSWDVWEFSSVNYTVIEPGPVVVSVSATSDGGLPNIDYLSILALESATIPEASDCSSPSGPSDNTNSINLDGTPDEFSVYPVPANNTLFIKSLNTMDEITVFRADGTKVKSINHIGRKQFEIQCNELGGTGLYIIQTTVGKEVYTRKFNVVE